MIFLPQNEPTFLSWLSAFMEIEKSSWNNDFEKLANFFFFWGGGAGKFLEASSFSNAPTSIFIYKITKLF